MEALASDSQALGAMDGIPDVVASLSRRRALSIFVKSVIAIAGGALAALLGAFAARPPAATGRHRWLRAGIVKDLVPDVPVARVLSAPANDGWYRVRSRETVFLVWDGARHVRAFSATCTHLGCRVNWDSAARLFRCPCHGGAYDVAGLVVEGPPPRPLGRVPARIDETGEFVLVEL